MRRGALLVLAVLACVPAGAASYYLAPDVPTDLDSATRTPWQITRKDGSTYGPVLTLPLPPGVGIDGLHRRCDGRWLLSLDAAATLGGIPYDPRDVILYDGGTFSLFQGGAPAGIPVGVDVDEVFQDAGDGSDLVLSFDTVATIGGVPYEPADLVRFSGGAFTPYLDASATVPPIPSGSDVTAAGRRGTRIVLGFDVPTPLGGDDILPGQLVAWDGTSFSRFDADPSWPAGSRHDAISFLADPGLALDLRLDKSALSPGGIRATWVGSTSAGAEDYGMFEGTLGAWYGHRQVDCSDDGHDLQEEIAPQDPSSYYLVVPLNATDEGSYGRRSDGAERPVGSSTCRPGQGLDC